jgi:sarcosine oxidase
MRHDYDVIVMGVGGMGSAALHALARRGARVCGIERFGVAHDRGSSHGDTRIIRKAYFEHPDYVPLLERAYELWADLEASSGAPLLDLCGFLTIGRPESDTIRGLEACYRAHDLPHERLAAPQVTERFPPYAPAPGTVAFFDPMGGYLRVEECVACHVQGARAAGADLRTDASASSWRASAEGVVVRTADGDVTARRLVMTTGAWMAPALERLGIATQVWRKVLFWYATVEQEPFLPRRFPTFYVEKDYGHFYGFPSVDGKGIKVAEHLAATPVDDPGTVERSLLADDEPPVQRFLDETVRGVVPGHRSFAVCLYTVTPDRSFVVGLHPRHPQVIIAGGFSGHGFKFAPVIGEIAAELALDGVTRKPIGFLDPTRFGE